MPEFDWARGDDGSAGESPTAGFAERFDILEQSGQLDPAVRPLVEAFLADIQAAFGVRLSEANAAQFATHVAIAFTRLRRGEEEAPPSSVVADEIAERLREQEFVERTLRRSEQALGRRVPEGEVAYLTVHLCAFVDSHEENSGAA